MIYEKDNIYYLKKGNDYEIADISIKYNRIKKRKDFSFLNNAYCPRV